MPPSTPTMNVQTLRALLVRSRLLSADDVQAVSQKWLSTAADPEDTESFRKFLVEKNYVTEYQAALLLRGKADNFFFDQYKLLDRIGQGRMAGVYKAVHAHLGQVVAMKILPPSKAKDANSLGRFHREARLATQLRHPNVVRGFQLGEANGLHYIVMEYLEGETLDETLNRRGGKLPPNEAVRIVYQALQGLQEIHAKGMIHRDLKPANLMLTPAPDRDTTNCTVKILDIGLGRALFDEDTPGGVQQEELTTEGTLLGTPDYLAPEQARNAHTADIRADLYSLGCVLYHLLTGKPPFPDTNVLSQIVRHATEPPKPLSEKCPPAAALQPVMDKLLAKKPEDRFATPADAAKALEPFCGGGGQVADNPELAKYLNYIDGKSGPAAGASSTRLPRTAGTPSEPPKPVPATPTAPPSSTRLPRTAPAPGAPGSTVPMGAMSLPTGQAAPASSTRLPPTAAPASSTKLPTGKLESSGMSSARMRKPPKPTDAYSPDDFDVELVAAPLPERPRQPRELPTRFEDLDRRDWILAGAGGAAMFIALMGGIFLSSLLKSKKPASGSGEGEEDEPRPARKTPAKKSTPPASSDE